MSNSPTCARCGASLARPDEACPRCLFGLALSAQPAGEPAAQVHTRAGAERPQPPTLEEVAAALPEFDTFEWLGRGGMGVVFKAREKALERAVAIKVLPRALGADAGFRERFLREARALARLAHPNIVTVHAFGERDGLCYLVMELVDGTNLRALMRARRLEPREALAIVRELCAALQFAHDEGIVHRDIKPENVLVERAGRVKIADFGLAKLVGPDASAALTETGQVVGTPHYMAPEQIERPAEVDHRADLFALGVVLYEMLTGSLPRGAFEPPSRRVAVDVRLDEIVLHALEREPQRRYQHALEVQSDVECVQAGAAPAAAQDAPRSAQAQPSAPSAGAPTARARHDSAAATDEARRRADPLRGLRALVPCALFWIASAVLWNYGAVAFGLGFALLAAVFGWLVHARRSAHAELDQAWRARSKRGRARLGFEALGCLALAWLALSAAHVAHWERGSFDWYPAYRSTEARAQSFELDPWALARLCQLEPLPQRAPRVVVLRSATLHSAGEAFELSAWIFGLLGASLVALAFRCAFETGASAALRRAAWSQAADLSSQLCGALVVLWVLAPLAARRGDQRLSSVERSALLPNSATLGDRVQAALVRHGLRVDVDQTLQLTDERSAQALGEARVLRAAADSPFERWSTSLRGPQRASPQIWATLASPASGATAALELHAGLYTPGSREGEAARALLAELERELAQK